MAADLLPREIRRRLLQDQLLLLEPTYLPAELADLGVLGQRQPLTLAPLDLVAAHPVTQRLRAQPQTLRDRGDRLTALTLQPDRLLAELRRPLRRTTHPC
jgi:hypothetical protein